MTSEGNIFYFNKEKKESVWEVPEEIVEAVAELEQEEEERGAQDEQKALTPPPAAFGIGRLLALEGKRKVEDPIPEASKAKGNKSKVEEETTKTATAPDMKMAKGEAEDGDEARQRQVAEEMAAEEEAAKKAKQGDTTEKHKKRLSLEEARALFKTLLQEKDINPLTPYTFLGPHHP
ncbi:hypothetical protein FRC01_001572 [Tulasnella sp. 417]|nr:hypothetical protein FRC01_001572 [Tulasnella sp. 417]